ncbi:MAG: hypothetical protein HC817_00350 [Saprospiraceae bacterium]|nr:hypothetical protein [Saprospiraceae bacterium]
MGFDILKKAGEMFEQAKDAIADKVDDLNLDSIKEGIADKVQDLKEAVSNPSEIFENVKEKFEDIKEGIQDKIADLTGSGDDEAEGEKKA